MARATLSKTPTHPSASWSARSFSTRIQAVPAPPVSIPGLPIETASGGIKAPQYFSPGVAGDHGEPIATFLQVGTYLVPNNLSANAHGNGYSDPNIMVPVIIENVQTDGGAFNVREGNHTLAGYQRDIDLSLGWNWIPHI